MVGILMGREVSHAVTGGTDAAAITAAEAGANRHVSHSIASARQGNQAAIGLMTGRTVVMDHGIAGIHCIAAEGMTAVAGVIGLNHRGMSY